MSFPFNEEALSYLKEWMIERESIRLKKEAGEPKPWTQNTFLRDYRFTNVRREDDNNSRWLIDNIAKADMPLEIKIANMLCARMYNNINTMKFIFPITFEKGCVDLDDLDRKLEGGSYLCNAYMPVNHQYAAGYFAALEGTSNGVTPSRKPALYRPTNLLRLGFEFLERGLIRELIDAASPPKREAIPNKPLYIPESEIAEIATYKYLRDLPTMGDFMAYQHWVDLTYIPELELSENTLVISGPGCVMGLQCLFAAELVDTYRKPNNTPDLKFPVNVEHFDPDQLIMRMQWDFDKWFPEWPYNWTPTVMSLENTLCEVHKYIKLKKGWGAPRNKYDGAGRAPSLFDIKEEYERSQKK